MSDDDGVPGFSLSAAAAEFDDAPRNTLVAAETSLVATISFLFPPGSEAAASTSLEATTSALATVWMARSRRARDSRSEKLPFGVFLRPSLWLVYFTSLFPSGG
ncbi:hypothetical protein [Methylosinus sp. Ce-a6]|uniref:hypothetical protein n=1 Tax=Methylosinus sp. Ce-a6 TaxID=2172005 RepID=UPI00135B00AB|nr:hypothetical protein [Methylosinus sp. Ce-a6]